MFPKPTAKNTRTKTSAQNIHFDSRDWKCHRQKVAGSSPGIKCIFPTKMRLKITILAISVSKKDSNETQEALDHEPTRSGVPSALKTSLHSKKYSDTCPNNEIRSSNHHGHRCVTYTHQTVFQTRVREKNGCLSESRCGAVIVWHFLTPKCSKVNWD